MKVNYWIMAGQNRASSSTKFTKRSDFLARGVKCVFISHQKKDRDEAKKIADYLINANIDVYFDEYDLDLKIQSEADNPKAVTAAICTGINNSSHMLVLISPNTIDSNWVPFEVGYGYDKTDLAVLTLKGIPKGTLPAYVRTATIVRDIDDLNKFIARLKGRTEDVLFDSNLIRKHNDYYNPVKSVMDAYLVDQ